MKVIFYLVIIFSFSICISFSQWQQIGNGFDNQDIIGLAKNNSIVVASTAKSVFLTTNNGDTWTEKSNDIKDKYVLSLAIIGNNIFAGTLGNGIYLSTNYGDTWIEKNNGLTVRTCNAFVHNGNKVFVGTEGGIFLSTDDGNTWIEKNSGLIDKEISSLAIRDNYIFAGTWASGVYVSTDYGDTWAHKNKGLTNNYVISIAINGNNIFAGTSVGGLFLSTDNGDAWTKMSDQQITKIITKDDIIVMGNHYGIFLSEYNGKYWTERNNGLIFHEVNEIVTGDSTIFVGTWSGGMFRAKLSDFGITGVEDENLTDDAIKLSPNPAMDYIEINVGYRHACSLQQEIKIYNTIGECVFTLGAEQAMPLQRIDVSGLAPGIYFVRTGYITSQFIKL